MGLVGLLTLTHILVLLSIRIVTRQKVWHVRCTDILSQMKVFLQCLQVRGFSIVCMFLHIMYELMGLIRWKEAKKDFFLLGSDCCLLSAPTNCFVHPEKNLTNHYSPCVRCAPECHKMCCMRITVKIAVAMLIAPSRHLSSREG